MRLVIAIVLASFFMPSALWGQTTQNPYEAGKASVSQAISNSLKANFERRQIEEWAQVSTMDKIRAYLAQPTSSLDSWIRIAQAMGLPTGTKLSPPSAYDSTYCKTNPTATICSPLYAGQGEGGGGAGSTGPDWEEPSCDENYILDPAGNMIVPAMTLPEPAPYKYGQQLWQADTNAKLRTNNVWSAIKVNFHMTNNPLEEHLRFAPVYAYQFCQSASCIYSVMGSRPAYFGPNATVVAGRSQSFGVGIMPSATAWSQVRPGWGDPPPLDYECPDGIGQGDFNQHWKACIKGPSFWAIPTHGIITATQIKAWTQGSPMAHCRLSDEFIRFLADVAYKNACADGTCDAPYSRVEKEDVRNGGQNPTVRDTGNVTNLPSPNNEGTPMPQPTDTPTDTPTQGPDWTDPGTAAPNPQSPTAQSIVDKAWDWGFPSITINLGSASCPTYTAQFYTYNLTLDSHCPFIEQNRAAISALMILLFTIAAGIIVLRA